MSDFSEFLQFIDFLMAKGKFLTDKEKGKILVF